MIETLAARLRIQLNNSPLHHRPSTAAYELSILTTHFLVSCFRLCYPSTSWAGINCSMFEFGPATSPEMGNTAEPRRLWNPLIMMPLFKHARKHVEIAILVVPYSLTGRWALEISFSKLDLVTKSVGFLKSTC